MEPGRRGIEWWAPGSGLDAGISQRPLKEIKSKEGFRKMAMDGHWGKYREEGEAAGNWAGLRKSGLDSPRPGVKAGPTQLAALAAGGARM